MPGVPMTNAGMMRLVLKNPSHPDTGNRPRFTAKNRMRKGAEIKTGVDRNKSEMLTRAVSSHVPCLYAVISPNGMPKPTLISIAAKPSWADIHTLGMTNSRTLLP